MHEETLKVYFHATGVLVRSWFFMSTKLSMLGILVCMFEVGMEVYEVEEHSIGSLGAKLILVPLGMLN